MATWENLTVPHSVFPVNGDKYGRKIDTKVIVFLANLHTDTVENEVDCHLEQETGVHDHHRSCSQESASSMRAHSNAIPHGHDVFQEVVALAGC